MLRLGLVAIVLAVPSLLRAQEVLPEPPQEMLPPPPSAKPEPRLIVPPSEERPVQQRFEVGFDGYVRLEYQTITPDRFLFVKTSSEAAHSDPFVGRNDGFVLGAARLNLRGTYRNLYLRLGFDGAGEGQDASDPIVGDLETALKDAYFRYTMYSAVDVYGGRFKPPYDIEELTPEVQQLFVHRSLESRGVRRHEGIAADMPGMRPERQLGVMVASHAPVELGDAPALGYMVAVTNGNSGDAALNDDDLLAGWLRLTGSWGRAARSANDEEGPATVDVDDGGVVGLSAFVNRKTFGTVPDCRRDLDVGLGFDVAFEASVFELAAQLLLTRTSHMVDGEDGCVFTSPQGCVDAPSQDALGGHVQVGVQILDTGFTPAYRFAYYDPRWRTRPEVVGTTPDITAVQHHTVGVRYEAKELPVVTWLEYTASLEEQNRDIANNRIEAAVQVSFE